MKIGKDTLSEFPHKKNMNLNSYSRICIELKLSQAGCFKMLIQSKREHTWTKNADLPSFVFDYLKLIHCKSKPGWCMYIFKMFFLGGSNTSIHVWEWLNYHEVGMRIEIFNFVYKIFPHFLMFPSPWWAEFPLRFFISPPLSPSFKLTSSNFPHQACHRWWIIWTGPLCLISELPWPILTCQPASTYMYQRFLAYGSHHQHLNVLSINYPCVVGKHSFMLREWPPS